jgi:hypothetical protein
VSTIKSSSPWFTSEFCYEIYWVFSLKASDRGPASSPALIPTSFDFLSWLLPGTVISMMYAVRFTVHGLAFVRPGEVELQLLS